ncbi:MAG: integration host factor subunit beta [Deltaproteobacteria bacterium]|jgi:integration host factor subunit beta|nr:integration host factor subunit beta [Deltaproteobacteria bacterium]
MTKSELARRIAETKKIPRGRAEALVDQVFGCIEAALRRDERVEIRGIGSFETRRYGAYQGRNPRTGDRVSVEPKCLPFFKAGKGLKDLLNARLTRTQDLPSLETSSPASPAKAETA